MIRRAVAFAFIAELGATISMVATFRLANEWWAVSGFAEWIMSRRLIAFVVPLITVGLEVALVRSLARTEAGDSRPSEPAALLIVVTSAFFIAVVMLALPESISGLVFGDPKYADLVLPVVCVSVAYSLHVIHYAGLRGKARYMQANLAHITVFGVVPLAMIFMFSQSVAATLLAISVTVIVVTCLSMLVNSRWRPFTARQLASEVRDLLGYSAPRMVAALLLIALTLLPASMVATTSGIEAAGFVALALSIVGIAATASAPIQVVLLPTASAMWMDGRQRQLMEKFRVMEMVIVVLGVAAVVLMPFVAPLISIVILGFDDPSLKRMLFISSVAIGPFLYFVCGRHIIDACTSRPLNTYALLVSLIILVILAAVFRRLGIAAVDGVVSSYVLATIVLAVSTRIVIYRLFHLQPRRMADVVTPD